MRTRSILIAALMVGLAPDFYDQQKPEKEGLKPQAQRLGPTSDRSLKDVLFPDYSMNEKEQKKLKQKKV